MAAMSASDTQPARTREGSGSPSHQTNPTPGVVSGMREQSAPRMRASDADRLATVKQLQDAVARGLLAPDEGSERMADAFVAVHLTDLDPLTEDLPPAPPERTAPGWRSLRCGPP